MKNFLNRYFTPTTIIWFLVHLVIVLFGVILISTPDLQKIFGVTLTAGIGGSLVATGFAGLIIYVYISFADITRRRLEIFTRAGLSDIFNVRSTRIKTQYDDRLVKAKEIDIIGFGLSHLRQDYRDDFEHWSNKFKVRILVLDPVFPSAELSYAGQRDKEEKNAPSQISNDVIQFIESVKNNKNINRDNFKVRKMKALPSINVFRIDDEMFFGPYLISKQSRNMPTFLVRRGGFLFEVFKSHFETIWSSDEFSEDAL